MMHSIRRFPGCLGFALLAAVNISPLPADTAASEADVEISGQASGYVTSAALSATDLVPDPKASGYAGRKAGSIAALRMRMRQGTLSLQGEVLLTLESRENNEIRINEAYGEFLLGPNTFVHAGRRVWSFGQSLGLNPADIFHDPLEDSRVLPQALALGTKTGVNTVGAEILLANGSALSILAAFDVGRGTRGGGDDVPVVRYSGLGGDGSLDYSVFAMGGDRPGAGVSISRGFGAASILYLDALFAKGRDRQSIAGADSAGYPSVKPRNKRGVRGFVTLGMRRTLAGGIDFSAEYSRDSSGYSDDEWRAVTSGLDAASPAASMAQGQALARINGLLNHYTLRKNYGFIHLAKENFPGADMNGEATLLHGFDDGSGDIGLQLHTPLGNRTAVGIKFSRKYGGRNAEFTLRPETNAVSIFLIHTL